MARFSLVSLLIVPTGFAQTKLGPVDTQGDGSVLEKVIVLSRHGVRSPLQTPEKLATYSSLKWPQWDAPPGFLTSHGRKLMNSLGSFYGDYYTPQGLFSGTGCARTKSTYVWSDVDERDVSTAKGFLNGLFPGCDVAIHTVPDGQIDPVIHPLKAHLGHPDKSFAAAEVQGRIGGDGNFVKTAYMSQFLLLDHVLGGCGAVTCSGDVPGRQVLLGLDAGIEPAEDDDHLIRESKGPLGLGSTLSEILLLEYTDGKPMDQVGFGRMSRDQLTQVLALHSMYFDLANETDYAARVGASNMMIHILHTLDPASLPKGSTATSTFGPGSAQLVFLATHDTNIANAAGFLQLHWYIPGDQADPTPPGGGLVFELRKRPDGSEWVRTRFISETLDQMHENTKLTLSTPPAIVPVFVPACSASDVHYDCPLAAFRKLVSERALAEFVTP
jgi:4-phytase/acid phosphatase